MEKGVALFWGAFLGCGAALFLIAVASVVWRAARQKKGPRLAGSPIPELGGGLDLGKRYDIAYGSEWHSGGNVQRLENVRILGYVGSVRDEDISKMYVRGRWLVLEQADGRRAYLMPSSIVSLREIGQ